MWILVCVPSSLYLDAAHLSASISRPVNKLKHKKPQSLKQKQTKTKNSDNKFQIKIKNQNQKDWHRQTPHFTYVTRARTTQPPSPPPTTTTPTTTTTTPTTTEVPAATTSASVDVDDVEEEEDDDRDDYYRPSRPESGTVASNNWPDRIDPIPTFWPTQNWWGTIDPMRQDPGGSGRSGGGQSRQSNRIPTYAPDAPATPAKAAGNNNNGSNKSRNRATGDGAARSGSSGRPSASPPYFQLLLAGLVQVRWPVCWASLPWLLGRLGHRRPLLAIVSVVVVAAASRFQILA